MTLDDFADMLARLRVEVRDERALLIAISDNVLSAEGEASIERARGVPLSEATAERRRRGKWRRFDRPKSRLAAILPMESDFAAPRKDRSAYGKRKARRPLTAADRKYLPERGGRGLEAALTEEFGTKNPAVLRDLRNGTLFFGTKKWLVWSSYHMQITAPSGTKFMPARIDFATGQSASAIEEGIAMETETWIADRMAKAGAPDDWLREQLPSGF